MNTSRTTEVQPPGAAGFDDEKYAGWFAWARKNLERDLEAAHAAAEAACLAEAEGKPLAEIQAVARQAGESPLMVQRHQIALAEWAYWVQGEFNKGMVDSLSAARNAVAVLETGGDIDAAMRLVDSMFNRALPSVTPASYLPDPLAEQLPLQRPAESKPFYRRTGVFVGVGALALIAVVIGVVVMGMAGSNQSSDTQPVMTTYAGVGYFDITLTNFPANQNIYIFIDSSPYETVRTDATGSAQVRLTVTTTSHSIRACLDLNGNKCPAAVTFT